MAHLRGLHDTRRLPAVSAANGKANGGKLTARLARLDHQQALLERQLAVWTEKQQVTKERLDLLDQEITQISRQISSLVRPRDARRLPAFNAAPQPEDSGAAGTRPGGISLEY